ncbi:MAG: NAD(P)/FAD-dependent oxidoreductase, partial [Cyclobacteriaceae bacterium]|nr:NAD(P)/FAD-dependent oxidoreductase [Cyclobacteriaceae bacterium]
MSKHHQILIIGGGTAGLMVAAQLRNKAQNLDIAIVEPSDKHYYQPAWTLVGAGTFNYKDTIRPEAHYIPSGVKWIKEFAEELRPDDNKVVLKSGEDLTYDYLVVCPGIQINLDALDGLKDTLGKNGVCSNYTDPDYTWKVLQEFKGGTALFTQANTPIKCGGAPQKIMYLADDYLIKTGVRDKSEVTFAAPGGVIFGVKDFADTLTG